jgi:hypothetical protein
MLFRTVQLALLPQGDQHTWPDLFHGDGVSQLLAVAAFIFVLSSDSIG